MVNNIGYFLLVIEIYMVGRKGFVFNYNFVFCWGGFIERNLKKKFFFIIQEIEIYNKCLKGDDDYIFRVGDRQYILQFKMVVSNKFNYIKIISRYIGCKCRR